MSIPISKFIVLNLLIYHVDSSSRISSILFDTNDPKHQTNDPKSNIHKNNKSTDDFKKPYNRIKCAKYKLWQHGAFALDEKILFPSSTNNSLIADKLEEYVSLAALKLGPIREPRRNRNNFCNLRGGDDGIQDVEERINALKERFGYEFELAIQKNIEEHNVDCELSCKHYYCDNNENSNNAWDSNNDRTYFASYSMGSVPPEDFSDNFGFPLDLIKVTQGNPLFNSSEAANVISVAEGEGVADNEYKSGKYKLGGNWLTHLPKTRQWFNTKLQNTFFPLIHHLFPEIITNTSTLRAHSVSLLKYNASHPRTDVHIDNGILAMTIAMTPLNNYKGGGTYFEHMDENVIHMDVGHGTFRPGSVRHGGHTVKEGTRYILGAFLLLVDKVEHVRRLKNKGSDFRTQGDLDTAEQYFEWALAINPKCTTCIKDWAEIHLTKKEYVQAEMKLRQALELLEEKDSDALFTLGVVLSEQGKENESMDAYLKSFNLNAQDAELCYNLAIQFGKREDYEKEFEMYEKAVGVDSKFGGAWLNWGVGLAERSQLDEAEQKFQKALLCAPEIVPKAMFNLALLHQTRTNQYLSSNKVHEAKSSIQEASKLLQAVKPLLLDTNTNDKDIAQYAKLYKPLRLQVHKLSGQILAALREFDACEAEFRDAIANFPEEGAAWDMLSRILQLQGKVEEASEAKNKAELLRNVGNMFGS